MSVRTYNKDHLKEHAGVALAVPIKVDPPQSSDPLVFWTQHEKEPFEVKLHPFATGQESSKYGAKNKFKPFTGRPELTNQLAPAIKESLSYATETTVKSTLHALREWWRVLDAVEAAAAMAGQTMIRVEDVRLLTHVHSEFAHHSGMIRQRFGKFRSLVDTTRISLGVRQTFWESPEDPDIQKQLPPQEQRDAVRFAVRNTCRNVLQRREQSYQLSLSDIEPTDPQVANLWRNVKYMRHIQIETGKILPTTDDLRNTLVPYLHVNTRGNFKLSVRESVFPNHWDADAVWHQCLLNTGWNPSTLTSLDVTRNILVTHFKDDADDPHRRFVLSALTYELIGEKGRSAEKDQFVTGQWKSLDGPGHLIKTYLEWVEPLRKILKEQLAQEKLKYENLKDAEYEARTLQFAQVKNLEQGCRSVWLYVDRHGKVSWIHNKSSGSGSVNGEQESFLDSVVQSLNLKRASDSARQIENEKELASPLAPVPRVVSRDFRVWYADYVYRASHGNMLHVKKALNHSRLGTTKGYTDSNILNQEASDAARRFLNILVGELDVGRIDLTILAHLYRYGEVTLEQEEILGQLRTLPKSRMKVACKDAAHPPAHINATANDLCDVQRCMLCLEHAVLLPESLDGIAMRAEELKALQGFLPIETWIDERYDIELKNNLMALQKFDLNQSLAGRKKWALAIAVGEHYVPGLPLGPSAQQMDLA